MNVTSWHQMKKEISDEELDTINMILYVKDRYNISGGGAYHEMAQLLKEMPCHYRLKERINELNKKWNIRPTPGGTIGIQQSLKERLTTCTKHMVGIFFVLH